MYTSCPVGCSNLDPLRSISFSHFRRSTELKPASRDGRRRPQKPCATGQGIHSVGVTRAGAGCRRDAKQGATPEYRQFTRDRTADLRRRNKHFLAPAEPCCGRCLPLSYTYHAGTSRKWVPADHSVCVARDCHGYYDILHRGCRLCFASILTWMGGWSLAEPVGQAEMGRWWTGECVELARTRGCMHADDFFSLASRGDVMDHRGAAGYC
jgi:hypothetical protein